jgi:hypothetical protein
MSVNSDYIIHRRSDKSSLYASDEKFWWSEQLNRWICLNPEIAKNVLSMTEFNVITHNHEKIAERFNVDVSHISKVASYLPVTHDGLTHKELRKKFALMIASNSGDAVSFFEREFKSVVKKKAESNEEFDFFQEILKPVLQKTSLILSGIDWLSNKNIDRLSTIFDETLTLNDRIELNLSVGSLVDELKRKLADEDCYFRVALFALGNDSLLSTMSESLISMIIRNQDRVLSSFNWEPQIPATGIPVLERVANADVALSGFQIKKSQRIRLYLDSAGYINTNYPSYSSLYFGSGSHACLGMSIGNRIWSVVINSFVDVNKKIELRKLAYRKNDNVFNVYDEIKVRFYD